MLLLLPYLVITHSRTMMGAQFALYVYRDRYFHASQRTITDIFSTFQALQQCHKFLYMILCQSVPSEGKVEAVKKFFHSTLIVSDPPLEQIPAHSKQLSQITISVSDVFEVFNGLKLEVVIT